MEEPKQPALFEMPAAWEQHWQDMPEYEQRDAKPWDTVVVQFRNEADRKAFLEMLGEHPERRKSIWFPQMDYLKQSDRSAPATTVPAGRYPVYVISKGRWQHKQRLTSRALDKLGIPYRLVVEPQEADAYAAEVGPERLLVLPFSNLGQGSIPARNWVWEHSVSEGARRHWILDDNMDGFYRLNRNLKVKVTEENPLIPVEEFVDRYSNVALAGLNYEFFADRRSEQPPYRLNTRIYSCILIDNFLPLRWLRSVSSL